MLVFQMGGDWTLQQLANHYGVVIRAWSSSHDGEALTLTWIACPSSSDPNELRAVDIWNKPPHFDQFVFANKAFRSFHIRCGT